MKLRVTARPSDRDAVREIVSSSGFFSPAEIDVAVELIDDRLVRSQSSDYSFVFADAGERTIGYACFGEIACTQGSYDLYWIAVDQEHRGGGIGKALLNEAERLIAQAGGRCVYVETSARQQYQPTREFYIRCGYVEEARLRDFYAPGDDKVILSKHLHPLSGC